MSRSELGLVSDLRIKLYNYGIMSLYIIYQ